MEVRKVLRKVTAVAASASFIGATILGAAAQDLANYPAPFVADGKFDAFIVVGADASTEDVLGAVDVGTSLQFELKKETAVAGGVGEATISEGLKVEKSGQPFNYGESISSIETTALGEDDLPEVLADGRYVDTEGSNKNTEDYTQELTFQSGRTANLTFYQDDQDAPDASDYLLIEDSVNLYNYTLEFDSAIEYDNSSSSTAETDLKTTSLTIQGGLYTITGVQLASGKIDELTLIAGEAVLWLTQNNPITKTIAGVEHTVEVLDVTEDADACQVSVDGVSAILDIDETQTVNGVQIGITDARAIHAQLQDVDVCQISLGASELKLKNGNEVDIDGVDVDGSGVSFIESTAGDFEEIRIVLQPDDDTYLAAGDEFIDPVFNGWKVAYGGLSADYETYDIKTSGSQDAELIFENNDGQEVKIPMFLNDSSGATGAKVAFGKDTDELLLANGSGAIGLYGQGVCFGTTSVDDCEGMLILGVTAAGETHVFEIQSIDTGDNETDLHDITYDRDYDDVDYTDGLMTALDLGSFGTINVNISEAGNGKLTVHESVRGKMETNAQGSFNISIGGGRALNSSGNPVLENVTIDFSENDRLGLGKVPDNKAATSFTTLVLGDLTDDEIEVRTPSGATKVGGQDYDISEDNDDTKVFSTFVGTRVSYDDEDDKWVKIEFPTQEVFGNVFLAPIRASVSTAEGGLKTFTISKLNVGSAKLDSEITNVGADNLIIVGGPCANRVTAQVLGLTYPACGAASGIAQGTAIIREVVQSSGKVALVVAGYDAADTQRATRVLANYAAYDLSGSSVEVSGTSLTNIQVKKSA